jgi:hypothetical protein
VYNVAAHATIELVGAQWDGELYAVNLGNKQVRIIIINLSDLTAMAFMRDKIRRAKVNVSKLV